jgi:hypothetical protein
MVVEKRMLTLVAYSFELTKEMAGDDVTVDFSTASRRKGTINFFIPRAPLDARLHQEDEDVEELLLSSTSSSGVVGIGVVREPPAS